MTDASGFEFEWNGSKARSNVRRHGVEFAAAITAFDDPLSLTVPDPDHSSTEERFLLVGHAADGRIVVVSFVERGFRLRIISARLATRHERRSYQDE
jgi:hypothetical protein